MGLRCLFGHEFGGREVERDRREDGEQVVVAYRTVETCERCGRRRVVSENKEVKPLRTGSAPESESTPAPEPEPAASTGSPAARAQTAESDPTPDAGAEVMTASGDESAAGTVAPSETPDPDAAGTTGADAPETSDASEDAAIILDDAATADEDEATEGDAADDTSADTGDAGGDDASADDDAGADVGDTSAADWPATATDADETAETDGAWPAVDGADDDGLDAETPTPGGPTAETGADPAPWPDEGAVERDRNGTRFVRPESSADDVDGETELRCPNCATAHAAASSSLRPGDVCPDCRKGYLAERAAGRNA